MTDAAWRDLTLLAICWIAYFALHSALASLTIKRKVATAWPGLMPWYRLGFNLLSSLLILPILWLSWLDPGPSLWRWQGAAAWLANGLAIAALLGFWLSLKHYDMQEFLGLRQLRHKVRKIEDQEHLRISPFHRFVRHPWYFFGLVLLWTRDMSATTLLTSVLVTLYFVIGSRMEERKLLVYHGDAYRHYMARVPALIPRPWKTLTREEAEAWSKE
jgi:protein-S-isoprenylcysteine O-methyltransferase Ste14